jgi:hypothetical protein
MGGCLRETQKSEKPWWELRLLRLKVSSQPPPQGMPSPGTINKLILNVIMNVYEMLRDLNSRVGVIVDTLVMEAKYEPSSYNEVVG